MGDDRSEDELSGEELFDRALADAAAGDPLEEMTDEEIVELVLGEPLPPGQRGLIELLHCPACDVPDPDYDFVEYKVLRCSRCRQLVHVSRYAVKLGPPGYPIDEVTIYGTLASG